MRMVHRYKDEDRVNPPLTVEEKLRVIKLREEKKTLKEIRRLTGISEPSISRVLKNAGVVIKPLPRKKTAYDRAAADLGLTNDAGPL